MTLTWVQIDLCAVVNGGSSDPANQQHGNVVLSNWPLVGVAGSVDPTGDTVTRPTVQIVINIACEITWAVRLDGSAVRRTGRVREDGGTLKNTLCTQHPTRVRKLR